MTDASTIDLERADSLYFQRGDESLPVSAPFIVARGRGSTVWDIHGREYLDAHASAWLCQIGHGRSEMAEVAAEQMLRLEHFTTHGDFRNPPAVELAAKLVELSPFADARVRFSTSGSEADDDALQVVRAYHRRRGLPQKSTVLTVKGAFHGHSYGGLELAGRVDTLPARSVVQLTMPDYRKFSPEMRESVTDFCVAELRREIDALGSESIAAMFGEPVFGPAGMFAPPPDYWPRMIEVLHENDILFVADEVVTAFGRTGRWFASSSWQQTPDVIVVAKGIASGYASIGATIISAEIARVLGGHHSGGSFAGSPVACALAVKNLEIIESEGLLENANVRGAQLRTGLEGILDNPAVVAVRGVGLMTSVWFNSERAISPNEPLDLFIRDAFGLIVMGNHERVVITPPLTITEAEVSRIVETLRLAIESRFS